MKNIRLTILLVCFALGMQVQAENNSAQLEHLGRGVIAIPSQSGGIFVSWRYLGTDSESTTFDLMRDGTIIKANIAAATCYTDALGKSTHRYQVITKVDGEAVDTTAAVAPWGDYYY